MSDTIAYARRVAIVVVIAAMAAYALLSSAKAQQALSTFADANGFIDVQALTCAQLANTYQEDADYLAAWYSGWYNGLAKKHLAHFDRVKDGEHVLIVYCKAHPQLTIIKAIGTLLNDGK